MKIRKILAQKGSDVVTVTSDRTVLEAMRVLVEHDIGSVVVVEADAVRGILTERDVLQLGAGGPESLATTPIREAMTPEGELLVAGPDDDIDYCMDVMTNNRVRHLPIMEAGELRGIVSIGDIVNAARRDAESENRYLKDYIRGEVR